MHSAARKPAAGVQFSVDRLFGDSATPKRAARPTGPPGSNGRPSGGHLGSSPTAHGTTPKSNARLPHNVGSSPMLDSSPSSNSISTSAAPPVPFSERKDKLSIQESLNGHLGLPSADDRSGDAPRVVLSSTMDPKKYAYRIAYERPMERSEDILREYYGIEEYGDASLQSQDDIIVCGRLCPESDQAKMTDTSTWLESSRALGSGFRVLLKFEPGMKVRGAPPGAGGIGLFPGCMVALKGRNGGGKLFAVDEIMMVRRLSDSLVGHSKWASSLTTAPPPLQMPPMDAPVTAPSEILARQHGDKVKQLNGKPMSLLVAAGPYTLDGDLNYEPLSALLDLAQAERPDVLVLLGPFVDAEHPKIRSGDIDMMPDELFRSQISTKLNKLLQAAPRTAIILVPNQRDLVNHHVAYPQSPFVRETLALPRGVKLLPNPTTFSINEVVFAITSVDVLFALRHQEFFKKCGEVKEEGEGMDMDVEEDPAAKDVMARTCRHLLRQRSFYPIFPAPIGARNLPSLNLDVTHQELIKMDAAGADVVIAPSMLKHFTRIVDSTIMINPSFLSRGNLPGTFARATVRPIDRDSLQQAVQEDENSEIEHRLWERCRVDVIKI
ncbi:BZ3500_MvSof-1268-A1-R1_Chr7-1g09237 [Microbotryum saponariae]|uniref:DNA polymerase alpha subunit B n=1 Tax=Microbotryum saponariae TaxID=289078 RepID=A0A2X0NCU6_9BASI|nr:BZ3501_MvSof-1269-A2-R1_Chr7-1g08942 [Microbotryum saponariae]SDA03056.1 BZ3500_MvSof-1268-A1-R1_Chr7-1g09237 [Microbotryum saponariae]